MLTRRSQRPELRPGKTTSDGICRGYDREMFQRAGINTDTGMHLQLAEAAEGVRSPPLVGARTSSSGSGPWTGLSAAVGDSPDRPSGNLD